MVATLELSELRGIDRRGVMGGVNSVLSLYN